MLASATTEWITAIGSAFAAVGTVGAVVFALWQVRRQDRRSMKMECFMSIRIPDKGGAVDVIALRGTNTGRRAVRIVTGLIRFDSETMELFLTEDSDRLPVGLGDGESAKITWDRADVERYLTIDRISAILTCGFVDSFGNEYFAPYPGMKAKHKGWPWRRLTEYVPS